MKNSLKVHNESVLEQVWDIFSEASSNVSPISFQIRSVAECSVVMQWECLVFGGHDSLLSQSLWGPSFMGRNKLNALQRRVPYCAQKGILPPRLVMAAASVE